MRIATYRWDGLLRTGRVIGDHVEPFPEGVSIEALLENLDRARHLPTETPVGLDQVEFLPPVPRPGKILCIGANYETHRLEMGRPRPERPLVFTRFADSLVGHRAALRPPPESEQLDFEGELAVILGAPLFRASESQCQAAVAGYACFNDGTVRDWQRHTSQFTPGKNFVGSGAFGPWLQTADEIPNGSDCRIETRVNGAVMQQGRLNDLTFGIPEILAYLSHFTPLSPGDVVATGTPAGVGAARNPPVWLKPGDQVEISVEGVGSLVNPVGPREDAWGIAEEDGMPV